MGIFDKVVVGLNKGVNTVSEGSKFIVEKARINTEIQNAEREKNSLFLDMGKLVYQLQESGEIHLEKCDPLCVQIGEKERQMENLRLQLQALEAQKSQQGQVNIPPNGIQCTCGYVNSEGSRFCAKCGRQLAD